MDFNFLFTYYNCFDKVQDFISQRNIENNTCAVIEVPWNNVEQTQNILFNILSQKEPLAFTILISSADTTAVNTKWLSILTGLLSHSAYNKFLEKKIIWFKEEQAVGSMNDLDKKLKKLSFNNTQIINLDRTTTGDKNPVNFFYLRSLNDESLLFNAVKSAFFSITTPFQIVLHNSINDSIDAIKERLNAYIQQNFTLADIQLLQKVFALNEKVIELQTNLLNKENHLITRQAYLDFLLNQYPADGNDQAILSEQMKIRKFYHYEYEILPMWYKQFGHIIKVLMGKRSFNSLFDDKAKKYKN